MRIRFFIRIFFQARRALFSRKLFFLKKNIHEITVNCHGFLITFVGVSILLLLSFSLEAQKIDTGTIALMKHRIIELESSGYPGPDSVQRLLQSMNPDGSWNGIDYESVGVSPWPPLDHLGNYVLPLARAYANPQSPDYHNSRLANGIHKSLDFWLIHNFTTQNWWEPDIGIPLTLCNIFILMGHEITYDEFLRGLNQMRGSYITQTGQNKIWRAGIQLKIGLVAYGRGVNNLIGPPQLQGAARREARNSSNVLLMDPAALIKLASDTLKANLQVQPQEGIQPDWSFHQHGVQLQLGNYGLDDAFTQAEWAYILKGTPFQYPEEKISILRHYILDGLSRVVWKNNMDISGLGRHIVYPNFQSSMGEKVLQLLGLMAKVDPTHSSEYQQTVEFNKSDALQPLFLKGNTYYWRSDFMVNRSNDNYISVRMCSEKIQSTESGVGENLLGAHLSDGATYIYKDGNEYKNIFPVWDWHRIPGVTSYSNKALPEIGWDGLHNESNFVGGVSDTFYGAAGMFFKRDSLQAHKGWFFGPGGLVCLGSGIKSSLKYNVLTTLNQCLLKGPVIVKKGNKAKALLPGQKEIGNDIKWVYQNGEGYYFFQRENVHVGAVEQAGNWHLIHATAGSEKIHKNVFNLWIDHGVMPTESSYAYMILPVKSEKDLNGFSMHPSVKVIQNTSSLQAVEFDNEQLFQMIFYKPDTLKVKDFRISVSSPCFLMIQQKAKALQVTVSVPPGFPNNIYLLINGHYAGKDCQYLEQKKGTKITFTLPGNELSGRSESRMIYLR